MGEFGIMTKTRKYIVLVAASLSLALVPVALAADATTSVYGGQATNTQKTVGGVTVVKSKTATTPKPTTATTGSLPFTGMNVGFIAIAGIVLAGVGYSLRRLGRDTLR